MSDTLHGRWAKLAGFDVILNTAFSIDVLSSMLDGRLYHHNRCWHTLYALISIESVEDFRLVSSKPLAATIAISPSCHRACVESARKEA